LRKARGRALQVSLIYLGITVPYILLSDRLVTFVAGDMARAAAFQSIKGVAFVVTTAILLYFLILRQMRSLLRLERARQSEERFVALGEISARVTHEYNNILMTIQPWVEVLRRRLPDERDAVTAVDRIDEALDRAKVVTSEVLRFARPAPPELTTTNVCSLIGRFVESIRPMVRPGIAIRTECASDAHVLADAGQLQQVLTNLVLNARDAIEGAGQISISCRVMDGSDSRLDFLERRARKVVRILVRDTGAGIAAGDLPHVFDPAFSTKSKGTGLGLAITRQIIRRHGGAIVARSTHGHGAAFHIYLPALDTPADSPQTEG
jgi:signal transduction histidine kinase